MVIAFIGIHLFVRCSAVIDGYEMQRCRAGFCVCCWITRPLCKKNLAIQYMIMMFLIWIWIWMY